MFVVSVHLMQGVYGSVRAGSALVLPQILTEARLAQESPGFFRQFLGKLDLFVATGQQCLGRLDRFAA